MVALVVTACGSHGQPSATLSWELGDAPPGATPEIRTAGWLRKNQAVLAEVERKRHISRLVIAGVIAYEALDHVHLEAVRPIARYSGPGKVHYREYHISEGLPVSKEVELLGYLPNRTQEQRRAILATDRGAIEYIGAIMSAYNAAAESNGVFIRCQPDLLATFYSAWTLRESTAFFKKHPKRMRPNLVGTWIDAHRRYLEDAAGKTGDVDC